MPGLYLAAILASGAGVALLDRRWRLVAWREPRRAAAAVLLCTACFLAWDAVGIAAGVFVKGDSPLLLGIDLAPHLPLEEPFFLAFLCYLALVLWAGAQRVARRRQSERESRPRREGRWTR
jgi:lycopene cyclase domain-containing protein